MSEKLSENFTLDELIYSDTAKAKGINNTPTALHKKILKHTCQYMLEKIRALLNEKYKEYKGKKVKQVILKVTSGYRSEKLNTAVGGSPTSQHCNGSACDLEAQVVYTNGVRAVIPYDELYENIKTWVKAGKMSVDQCIQEAAKDKKTGAWYYWVHASHHPSGRTVDRRQFLKFKNGMYSNDGTFK